LGEGRVLDRTIAANVLWQGKKFADGWQGFGGQHLCGKGQIRFVAAYQQAFQLAVMAVAKGISPGAAQGFQPGQKPQNRQDPRPEFPLFRAAICGFARQDRRRKVQRNAVVPGEFRLQPGAEGGQGIQPRNLVFVLVGQNLGIGFGGDAREIGRADPFGGGEKGRKPAAIPLGER
jgi:hypothetical protein